MSDLLSKVEPLVRQASWLDSYRPGLRFTEIGYVLSVGDGIAWIHGLPSMALEEIILCDDGSRGLVYHLGSEMIGVILLEQTPQLTSGTPVRLSGQRLSITVGDELLGRVIDPLGQPLDGLPVPHSTARRPLESPAPPLVARDFVRRPLYSGNKIIDTLIPLGKGQRQLIIGDDGTGKSALALDIVLNQRDKQVYCIYVLIGQKRSDVIATLETLRESGALAHTVLVVAEATAMSGLKYLTPFAGCAVAEGWLWQGRDTLVIYDDLSTHARAYRDFPCCCGGHPAAKPIPAISSICMRACWSVPPVWRLAMAVAASPHCHWWRLNRAKSPPIFPHDLES